jgi:hypothetical protein
MRTDCRFRMSATLVKTYVAISGAAFKFSDVLARMSMYGRSPGPAFTGHRPRSDSPSDVLLTGALFSLDVFPQRV